MFISFSTLNDFLFASVFFPSSFSFVSVLVIFQFQPPIAPTTGVFFGK